MSIVGPRWSARSHELRDLLARNNVSHGFYDVAKPEGRRLLKAAGVSAGDHPIALLFDGRVLVDPPNEALAQALGVQTRPASSTYDLAVVGAGPAGLTAAMYAASEGLRTLLLEREAIGGQAGTTSMIRNYLGFPRGISGRELASRAVEQALAMGTEIVFTGSAVGLKVHREDLLLTLGDDSRTRSRTVVIATGVTYRRLQVPGLDELIGAGCFTAQPLPRRLRWKANGLSSLGVRTRQDRLRYTWRASLRRSPFWCVDHHCPRVCRPT